MSASCIVSSRSSQKPFAQKASASAGPFPATPMTSPNVTSVSRHAITNEFGTQLRIVYRDRVYTVPHENLRRSSRQPDAARAGGRSEEAGPADHQGTRQLLRRRRK